MKKTEQQLQEELSKYILEQIPYRSIDLYNDDDFIKFVEIIHNYYITNYELMDNYENVIYYILYSKYKKYDHKIYCNYLIFYTSLFDIYKKIWNIEIFKDLFGKRYYKNPILPGCLLNIYTIKELKEIFDNVLYRYDWKKENEYNKKLRMALDKNIEIFVVLKKYYNEDESVIISIIKNYIFKKWMKNKRNERNCKDNSKTN